MTEADLEREPNPDRSQPGPTGSHELNVVNPGHPIATVNVGRDVGHLTNTLRTSYQKASLQELLDLRADSVPVIVAHLDELIGKDTPGMTPSERLELLNGNYNFSGGDWRSWN